MRVECLSMYQQSITRGVESRIYSRESPVALSKEIAGGLNCPPTSLTQTLLVD
jgi:hypothetical protein